jgi:S1-C subfamily serine protease
MNTQITQQKIANIILISVLASAITGFFSGGIAYTYINRSQSEQSQSTKVDVSQEESAIIDVVDKTNPSVVSISISKQIAPTRQFSPFNFFFPNTPQDNSEQEQTIGGGSGFIVSSNGLIVTNRHVVEDDSATYTVVLSDGEEIQAEVKALHPTQDLALIQIDKTGLVPLEFANSDEIKVGQTAIAIGNALAEFDNTVSRGVISGLSRSIIASDGRGNSEQLSEVIQTDAAINQGNSGGPLLDINAKVVGVNVATAEGAQSIGFAIPGNIVIRMIEDYNEFGKIRVPYIGVRYTMITPNSEQAKQYGVNQGALIIGDAQAPAIVANSPAAKAGLQSGDIITKINDTELTIKQPLASVLARYKVGDTVNISIIRDGNTQTLSLVLEERNT